MRRIVAPLLADLQTEADEIDRVAWFWPTFHLQCGAVLRTGHKSPQLRLICEVRRPGAPVLPWLTPLVSAEPLAPSPLDCDRLARCFDELERSPPPRDGIVRDGCPYEISIVRAQVRSTIEGNPLVASAGALAQLIVELALSRGRWRSTRGAFVALQGYLD